MEQANRSAIILLARAGHSTADIVRLTKLPSSTVYDVFKAFKDIGKTERKHHALRSDAKRTPRFLAGLKRPITANSSVYLYIQQPYISHIHSSDNPTISDNKNICYGNKKDAWSSKQFAFLILIFSCYYNLLYPTD